MEPANRELTDEQRLFLALGPEKGWSNARTIQEFSTVFPDRQPPGRGTVSKLHQKLLREKTVKNCRKGRSGHPITVCTPFNIQWVESMLETEVDRIPGQPGSSARRNPTNLAPSTFNKISKKILKLHPYIVKRNQKITPANKTKRMRMCSLLESKTIAWYRDVTATDEAIFTLGGK